MTTTYFFKMFGCSMLLGAVLFLVFIAVAAFVLPEDDGCWTHPGTGLCGEVSMEE